MLLYLLLNGNQVLYNGNNNNDVDDDYNNININNKNKNNNNNSLKTLMLVRKVPFNEYDL